MYHVSSKPKNKMPQDTKLKPLKEERKKRLFSKKNSFKKKNLAYTHQLFNVSSDSTVPEIKFKFVRSISEQPVNANTDVSDPQKTAISITLKNVVYRS